MTTIDRPAIDLLDPASFGHGHPYEQYRWLRDHDPVHFHPEPEGPGFWAVTGYADVREVGRRAGLFSSRGTILIPDSTVLELPGNHEMMLQTDPPRHGGFRRLMIPDFMPRAVARMGDRVGELAERIIDAVCERGECDLVDEVAGEMPSYVVADMLGLPLDDGRELYKLTETIHASPETRSEEAYSAAINGMFEYANSVYTERPAHPTADLSSRLAHAEVEGRRFDELDFALMFLLLVDAGGDTTRNVVGGGMQALFDAPGERARLCADLDAMMPSAIEEFLRWVSPVAYMRRTATQDTSLGGTQIKAGEKVVMYYGSANRDSAAFDHPDTLDLTRTPNEHVAFGGGGPHFCLGAHLARLELKAIMRELLVRLPDMEPAARRCGRTQSSSADPNTSRSASPARPDVRRTAPRAAMSGESRPARVDRYINLRSNQPRLDVPPARDDRDEALMVEIARVHAENLHVYEADKVWAQLDREGTRVAHWPAPRRVNPSLRVGRSRFDSLLGASRRQWHPGVSQLRWTATTTPWPRRSSASTSGS